MEKDLKIVITSDSSQAEGDIKGFGDSLSSIGDIAAGVGLERLGEKILEFGKEAASFSVDYAANLEQNRIAFNAFTGSAQKGGEALAQVAEFARKTPFLLPDVEQAAKQILGFALAGTDNLIPMLKDVGNLAAATNQPMAVAVDLFARAKEGIFNIREFGQFGITRQELEQFGVQFEKTGKVVNQSELLPALEKLVKSRFGDLMAQESKTFTGTVNNIKDDMGRLAASIIGVNADTGDIVKGGMFDQLKTSAQEFLKWLDAHQKDITKTFQDIYGAIKTVFSTIADVIKPVIPILENFFSSAENRKAVIIGALTAISLAFLALGINVAIALAPITLTFLGIVALVAGLKLAWDANFLGIRDITKIVLADIEVFWNQHGQQIISTVQNLGKQIEIGFKQIADFINMVLNSDIGQATLLWINQTIAWWTGFLSQIGNIVLGGFEIITNLFKLGMDTETGILQVFTDLFTGNWKKLWNDVKQIFTSIINDIKGIFQGFADFAMGIINGIISGVQNAAKTISGAGSSAPHRALGGYASGLTLVGESGPELVSLPTGSYVHSNTDSKNISGAQITINVTGNTVRNDNDLQSIIDAVQRAIGRQSELVRMGAL